MELEIRRASSIEARLVFEVVQAAFEEYRGKLAATPGALRETLEEMERDVAEGCVLVAWRGEEAVGTARYRLEEDHVYVGRVAVLPKCRGQGIGAALMGYIERIAPGLRQHEIRLGTRRSMPSNIAFYKALGYRVEREELHSSGLDYVVWFVKNVP
ncbi:MAG: GNAT family N-acetyltransferase [Chloroflexia bacterium]